MHLVCGADSMLILKYLMIKWTEGVFSDQSATRSGSPMIGYYSSGSQRAPLCSQRTTS